MSSNNKDNSFRRAIYHVKMAEIYYLDVIRDFPLTIGGKSAKKYLQKIQWCLRDFATEISFPQEALEQFKKEISGDLLFHSEVSRLCIGLSDEQKSVVENLLQTLIDGGEITYEIKKP